MTRPENNLFGKRLRQLRDRQRMNQKALGELIGLSKNMIARYERGEHIPDIQTAMQLAAFFGVSMDYLCGFKD